MEKTFLIIDDDINIRKMLSILIKNNGLGRIVCELQSGEHAVEEILFYNADIVLVDLLLPTVDGVEIVKSATKKGYNGKFVMISQIEDEKLVSMAYESGILFFIDKPINSIEVINVLKGICNNIDLENSLARIKNVLSDIGEVKESSKGTYDDGKIEKIFSEIGILGEIGSKDLQRIINEIMKLKKKNPSATYQLHKIYEGAEIKEEDESNVILNKKALEQRIRRTIQKAFRNIAEIGCHDYDNHVFFEYSTLLFDFKQIRQEMRHINNPLEEPGKINTKKFIEGIIIKLTKEY